jgi:hypothetical protein
MNIGDMFSSNVFFGGYRTPKATWSIVSKVTPLQFVQNGYKLKGVGKKLYQVGCFSLVDYNLIDRRGKTLMQTV